MVSSSDPELKNLAVSLFDALSTEDKISLFNSIFSGNIYVNPYYADIWKKKFSDYAEELLTFNLRKEDGIKSIDKSVVEFGDIRESGVSYDNVEF